MLDVLRLKMLTGVSIMTVKLIYPFTLSKMQMLHVGKDMAYSYPF